MEDVQNNLEIIHHDPLTRGKPVNGSSSNVVVLAQPHLHITGDRFQMRFRCRRAENEKIREGRDAAQIEDEDVFRLFVRRQLRANCC